MCESLGITSPDGEYLPFVATVQTEGRPEEWLNKVEEGMFAATKKFLYKTLEDSKSECSARRTTNAVRGGACCV